MKATIILPEFLNLRNKKSTNKTKKLKWAIRLIEKDTFWQNVYDITQAVFPGLRVLRLADRSEAGMHMLYYYIRMAKLAITKHCMKLNQVNFLVPDDEDVNYESESEDEINTDDEDDTATKKGKMYGE